MLMTFAESYVLASKVRSKLTREASDPKSSLRLLVLQANMLDNLMDHIAEHTAHKQAEKVSFALSEERDPRGSGPLVTEYELESDSDSDYDSESDYESDSDEEIIVSDSDDYYYSSEEEDMEVVSSSTALATVKTFKLLPVMDLQGDLLVIYEEEEHGLPELLRSTSDDSDSEDDEDVPHYTLAHDNACKILSEDLLRHHGHKDVMLEDLHRHQRHNAIYLMEHVF